MLGLRLLVGERHSRGDAGLRTVDCSGMALPSRIFNQAGIARTENMFRAITETNFELT